MGRGNLAGLLALAALLAVAISEAPAAVAEPPFQTTLGFATKTGFRGVFAWQASSPVSAVVRFGDDPSRLDSSVAPIPRPAAADVSGGPDTAGMAVVDGLQPGRRYWFQVEDRLTGQRSPMQSFHAANAYAAFDGATYSIDLLVQLDAKGLPDGVPADQGLGDLGAAVNILAERVYDALDGYARIGTVLVTDTNLDYAANTPAYPAACRAGGNAADVLVQTTVPFDSHTWAGWAIADPCLQISLGRAGWLVANPWRHDLDVGYTLAHELMHYGFNTPDLYGGWSDCRNLEWNGSLMHNRGGWSSGEQRWELTELERDSKLTPCEMGDADYSWDRLRERYTRVPRGVAPVAGDPFKARGNPDGGALRVYILDREPGRSTLRWFPPDDDLPMP